MINITTTLSDGSDLVAEEMKGGIHHIIQNSPINVRFCNIYYIFGHVQKLTFVVVNFLVMFTNFGHIHSVILILSSE